MPAEYLSMNSPVVSQADGRQDVPLSAIWDGTFQKQLAVAGALLVAGLAALGIDLPLSHVMFRENALRPVHRFLASIEPFGQPYVVLLVALALFLCDNRRRSVFWRLLAASIGAGLAADIVKLCIARVRPHHYDFQGTAFETFEGLFPGLGRGAGWQSCPSGHVAVAAGLCLALSTVYPRGRWLFVSVASLVALQRIEAGAHFLSDTIWGAAVAYLICMVVFRPNFLGTWFDNRERLSASRAALRLPTESAISQPVPFSEGRAEASGTLPTLDSERLSAADFHSTDTAGHPILRIRFTPGPLEPVSLSIVIPISKVCGDICRWHRQLELILSSVHGLVEIIYVLDSSVVNAARELGPVTRDDARVQVVAVSGEFGRSIALSTGIGRATGQTIIVLETDIQQDPQRLPALLAQLNVGSHRYSRAA